VSGPASAQGLSGAGRTSRWRVLAIVSFAILLGFVVLAVGGWRRGSVETATAQGRLATSPRLVSASIQTDVAASTSTAPLAPAARADRKAPTLPTASASPSTVPLQSATTPSPARRADDRAKPRLPGPGFWRGVHECRRTTCTPTASSGQCRIWRFKSSSESADGATGRGFGRFAAVAGFVVVALDSFSIAGGAAGATPGDARLGSFVSSGGSLTTGSASPPVATGSDRVSSSDSAAAAAETGTLEAAARGASRHRMIVSIARPTTMDEPSATERFRMSARRPV
jgi:hypothetical protein